MRAARCLTIAMLSMAILIPGRAWAKGLEPDEAAGRRAQLESNLPADPRAAIDQLRLAGEELGDPELLLFAAQLARNEADTSRDAELAELAAGLSRIARDIGSYLADERNYAATDWRPIPRERAASLASEAASLATDADALAQTIHAERAAAAAEAERLRLAATEPTRERRPGTGLIAGGSAALVIGVGGLGLLGAGISRGLANQREAESLILPAELARLDELDRKGASANAIAYTGIALAGVGISVGVALIVVGVKKRKAAGPSSEAGVHVGGWLLTDSAGLTLAGSF